MELQRILKDKFGFETFRPGQEIVIRDVLRKKNQIAILPTGSGKSLCFQLPAYLIEGTVVIISPLVALMEDQVAILKQQGEKRVAALNSFHSYREREQMIAELHQYKFVFISPEMLAVPKVAQKIQQTKLAFIVVDEAHCISQWGFDFRPDYLRISEFLKKLHHPTILALTATADHQVIQDIRTYLNLENPAFHKQSLDRPNISYAIYEMSSEEVKTEWLLERLTQTAGPGIIYVASRKRADELAMLLKEKVRGVASYHAGIDQEDRAFVQSQFLNGELEWICATNAFGMGIHKDDVRQVIHEHIPSTMANYIQEVGRAGRDRQSSTATLIYTKDDIQKARFIMQEDLPNDGEIRYFASSVAAKKSFQEAAMLSGVSETGKRILQYYLERLSVEETVQQIQKQRREKEVKLQQMIDLLKAETCLRAKMLSFFGEELEGKPSICCSVCHAMPIEALNLPKQLLETREWKDWSTRLTQLLG